ncbi:hypothetical protein HYH03_010147 [Edaphochlamys debaryana]|uniref:Uncharacterized protein n=1 Tax=Edaphochlamys debaryana TaxID=47281 RepID=A0A835XXA4_9CHLO|nr:hypothetical protein HYH03_010147 [Edaphochlamys debaryana]|eukprot:KAG2491580.1 hypothetical protein HYH03_010147 [Edaphochlamys debaryana]
MNVARLRQRPRRLLLPLLVAACCLGLGGQRVDAACPSGWFPAVGTIYDSWPKPGSKECVDYSGCQWAGQFFKIDGGSGPCINGAQWLDGGNGDYACRFPESTVRSWSIAATYMLDDRLLGRKLQVMVENRPAVTTVVNVRDVCSDDDCDGCCAANTGGATWRLIDIEKWPASTLLGFNPSSGSFDINNVDIPTASGMRPGAPEDSAAPSTRIAPAAQPPATAAAASAAAATTLTPAAAAALPAASKAPAAAPAVPASPEPPAAAPAVPAPPPAPRHRHPPSPRPPSPPPSPRPPSPKPPPPPPATTTGCPSGWTQAVGTMFDSWPKPGTVECLDHEGCRWAGMFAEVYGGGSSPGSCVDGAQWLNGGTGIWECRFPEWLVRSWNIAATYDQDQLLLGRKLQVIVQGAPQTVVTVNVRDTCSDCGYATGNKAYKLIHLEKWPASALLGFSTSDPAFDINDVTFPTAVGLRPGAPESSVMPLCYKDVGAAT